MMNHDQQFNELIEGFEKISLITNLPSIKVIHGTTVPKTFDKEVVLAAARKFTNADYFNLNIIVESADDTQWRIVNMGESFNE